MKETILDHIYLAFSRWSSSANFACRPGCASCCTDNVTLTALEAGRIVSYCHNEKPPGWLAGKIVHREPAVRPSQTTNEYVEAILAGEKEQHESQKVWGSCVFLESAHCSIYPVRPFSCRCFVSTTICQPQGSATVADAHLYGAMAAMQIIEHLGQFDSWGNMTDILAVTLGNDRAEALRQHLRPARPLPGFAIPEEYADNVAHLLQMLFTTRVGTKTIEQILNGR